MKYKALIDIYSEDEGSNRPIRIIVEKGEIFEITRVIKTKLKNGNYSNNVTVYKQGQLNQSIPLEFLTMFCEKID